VNLFDDARQLVFDADVSDVGASANLVRHIPGGVIAIDDGNRSRALTDETPGECTANAARAAGDDNNAVSDGHAR
jgi:hypothetical protein